MEQIDTNKDAERLILVCVDDGGDVPAEESLDELEELARTAGAETVGRLIQRREAVHHGTYVGKGKLQELKELAGELSATGVVCDDELSPGQMRRMAEELDMKVLDRTVLILDIFAARASSAEGKAQVELAQLKYRLSRLSGLGKALSRQGGGIGTRGPGETKLESDRRHIKDRISQLNAELEDIRVHRGVQRERREKSGVPVIALAGYTNAGKSTLLNLLTGAGAFAEDKLFATLDTLTKRVKLPGGTEALLTDTVGFIRKLPHGLVQAFRATLEETARADIIVHVIDAANPMREWQIKVVYETLAELECIDKPIIAVFNKMDRDVALPLPQDNVARERVQLSAATGLGAEGLLAAIEVTINSLKERLRALIPYTQGQLLSMLHGKCEVLSEEHTESGTLVEFYADAEAAGRVREHLLY